jgi:fructan beta-fructosidase
MRCVSRTLLAWVILVSCGGAWLAAAEPDVLIADFEGEDYGQWTATGEAFGPGPARGTLPGQMALSGFEGKGLVNSFFGGDRPTGTLTSPPFVIQRKYLNFLIGGGWSPEQTCINLLIDGKAVRTATGPNRKPGGTERLDPYSWEVEEFRGKTARIEIVDKATGGWGHINVDHLVQSDRRSGVVSSVREIAIEKDYVQFQIGAGQGPRNAISLAVADEVVRSFAGTGSEEAFWISWDVSKFVGKSGQLKIEELPSADGRLVIHESVAQSDQPKGTLFVVDKLYQETYRPQFHFTPKKNWTNDPNGLVFYEGEYHLFFQHNPEGINWGNMTWGHAVSRDLVHWRQLEHAIYPDRLGTIFSGSAVVDWNNTAGFQSGDEKVLVAMYTSAGAHAEPKVPFTQSIAYSNDRGRTWTKYEGNPVLGHIVGNNRDPKVIWHEPTGRWVMALYLDKNDYALFGSPNLKEWTKLCDVPLPEASECPDFFELPIDGDENNKQWLFWGGNGTYWLGSFDGRKFTPQNGPFQSRWGANCYAAQTYSDIPASDGRRIQIAWMAGGKFPGMPFNQQMSFPRELTLRTTPEGVRLFIEPVREIETVHGEHHEWTDVGLKPDEDFLSNVHCELLDVRAEIELGGATEVGFKFRGEAVRYDAVKKTLSCRGKSAPLELADGVLRLRVLVDRTSLEIFAQDGQISMAFCFLPPVNDRSAAVFAQGGEATIRRLDVWELESAW